MYDFIANCALEFCVFRKRTSIFVILFGVCYDHQHHLIHKLTEIAMTGSLDILDDHDNNERSEFICGAVEGFYGRPWTTEQRKELFRRMNNMGLNTYLYAPKDDYKHRAFWRELYSVEEADHLTGLIEAAREQGISFVYALSPGLDITFSSTKELTYLKRKLDQVAQFGCNAFALLFDDIEHEMCEADKQIFQSFAHAQVSVTNEIYQHLSEPVFLFCPTEYCATRAIPSVTASEYLNTIGAKLLPKIDIMWTGPKVISKQITVQSLKEITTSLRRRPVIWDNIHANDYDQKRLFLGPYDGRNPEIIPYLRGVLTNPNCEFEANYIALHTLAQWSRACVVQSSFIPNDSVVNADIKLETENDNDVDSKTTDSYYSPRVALRIAITEWLPELYTARYGLSKPSTKNLTVLDNLSMGVNTCMAVTPTTNNIPIGLAEPLNVINNQNQNSSLMQPTMNPVNSLCDSPVESSPPNVIAPLSEPMECVPSPKPELKQDSDSVMQVDNERDCDNTSVKEEDRLTSEELLFLCDLFYLPYEHGSQAVSLLNEFHWLKTNAHIMTQHADSSGNTQDTAVEWRDKAEKFNVAVKKVISISDKFNQIPNRSLMYDIYPYLWDMRGILSLLNSYVKWLALGEVPFISVCYLRRTFSWCSKGYKEAFMSGDQEPWVFRGGLAAEFQRMLPIDGAHDLFTSKAPSSPSYALSVIRPYLPSDKETVYKICRKTCDDGMDGTDVFPDHPDLISDKLIGGYVQNGTQYCFVIESEEEVVGYVLACLDVNVYNKTYKSHWLPKLHKLYPKPDRKDNLSPAEEIIMGFYEDKPEVHETILKSYPSVVRIDILPEKIEDPSIVKRALACVMAALKTNGSTGMHCEVSVADQQMNEFYSKLGFVNLSSTVLPPSDDTIMMGRAI